MKVCWLIREGLDTEKALKALFGLPAARFRVVDRDDPGRLLTPWDDPADRDLGHRARLQVFGTIGYLFRADRRPDLAIPGATWFRTGTMDGFQFSKRSFPAADAGTGRRHSGTSAGCGRCGQMLPSTTPFVTGLANWHDRPEP